MRAAIGTPVQAAATTEAKFDQVRERLRGLGSALVAFSGGIDSTLILKLCHQVLGDLALAKTAAWPSIPPEELEAAKALAKSIGVHPLVVDSHELENDSYAS